MKKRPLLYILVSAALFGMSPPLAKLLIKDIPPVVLASLLYIGAFIGLSLFAFGRNLIFHEHDDRAGLTKKDLPSLAGAVLSGGIVAPICLMFGLTQISGFAASLLLNLEGVATALIAVLVFKENAGKRLWLALVFMTSAAVFLTWDPGRGQFNLKGTLLITLSMICWGVDNNLTRSLSTRDPIQITRIKGFISGSVSLALAHILGMGIPWDVKIVYALLLGSLSYGISLVLFIKALEGLGSFRAGAFFSLAPFIGALTSLLLLQEWVGWVMFPATVLTIVGVWLIGTEEHGHFHDHEAIRHAHMHNHRDMHRDHKHSGNLPEPHHHEHKHAAMSHIHGHWPDTHHRHEHGDK